MSTSQGRRRKAVPKMVESKFKAVPPIKRNSTETKVTSIPVQNNSKMYVCSPDIWKKFGIKIDLEQNSKKTDERENVKLDTAKIKQSLSSKILAKQASQIPENRKLDFINNVRKTPERPIIIANEIIETPKSFLTIDPQTNNFIISDEYSEVSYAKQMKSNSDVTNELLKLNENEELINSVLAENSTNSPSKDIIDTIIIPLDDVIEMDDSTSVSNLVETTNSSESIPIDDSLSFNDLSVLSNINNDNLLSTAEYMNQSNEIIITTPDVSVESVLENNRIVKINNEIDSNSEIIIYSNVTVLNDESELNVESDISPEIIQSDIKMGKIDMSISNNDQLNSSVENQNNEKLLTKECLTENITTNDKVPSSTENIDNVNKIVEYLKQFFNKNNSSRDKSRNNNNQSKNDNTVKCIDNNGVEEPGGVIAEISQCEEDVTPVINASMNSNKYSNVYKKQRPKKPNFTNIHKHTSENAEEAVTTFIDDIENTNKIDLKSHGYWFGKIRTEMSMDVDDYDEIDECADDHLEVDDTLFTNDSEFNKTDQFEAENHENIDSDKVEAIPVFCFEEMKEQAEVSIHDKNNREEKSNGFALIDYQNVTEKNTALEEVNIPKRVEGNITQESESLKECNSNSNAKELASNEQTKVPKKRGRKKKREIEKYVDSSSSNENQNLLVNSINESDHAHLESNKSLTELRQEEQIKVSIEMGGNEKCDTVVEVSYDLTLNDYLKNINSISESSRLSLESDKSSIDVTQEEQIKIPKKRGRKKKCETVAKACGELKLNNNYHGASEYQNDTELDKPSIPTTQNEQIKIPKKRGRKKKCDNVIEAFDESDIISENSQTDIEAVESSTCAVQEEQIKIPKKRGRKRKCETAVQIQCEQSDLSLNEQVTENSLLDESSINLTSEQSINAPKKRGRKRKTEMVPIVCDETSFSSDNGAGDDFEESILNKRSRKKKQENDYVTNDDDVSNYSNINEDDEPKKRKKKTPQDLPNRDLFLSIVSLYDKNGTIKPIKAGRKTLEQEKIEQETTRMLLKVKTLRKCAICSEMVLLKNWPEHNMNRHNLLGWLEGDEPIDMGNDSVLINLLQKLVKIRKALICDKCNERRSSAYGFLCHIRMCQKSEEEIDKLKVKCELCDRYILPQSFKAHMNGHKEREVISPSTEAEVKSKRKAAEAAKKSFKELKDVGPSEPKRCNGFKKYYKYMLRVSANESQTVQDDCDSTTEILKLPKERVYRCLLCDIIVENKPGIINHVKNEHTEEERNAKFPPDEYDGNKEEYEYESDEDDDEDDDSISKRGARGKRQKISHKVKHDNVASKKNWLKSNNSPGFNFEDSAVYNNRKFHQKCGIEFVNENFTKGSLFTSIFCKTFEPISTDDVNYYLPEFRRSCNIAHTAYKKRSKHENIVWKKYDLFESDLNNDHITMWCGGSVCSLGWIPGEREEQYLVVSTFPTIKEKYLVDTSYQFGSALQIWNVGSLSNDSGTCQTPASLAYCMAHDHGIVWDMDWCPSGCDDDCKNSDNSNLDLVRMGLLAIACSDGNAYIYAVPHPTSLPECELRMYKTKPSVILCLDMDTRENIYIRNYQAVKIFWTRNKGHNLIAVGYSNGTVALFDITVKSILLRKEADKMITYSPYFSFQAFTVPINGLVILPMNDTVNASDVFLGISSINGCGIWQKSTPINHVTGHYTNVFSNYPWPSVVSLSGKVNQKHASSSLNMILAHAYLERIQYHGSYFSGGGIGDTGFFNNAMLATGETGQVEVWPVYYPAIKWHRRLLTNSFKLVSNTSRFKKAVLSMAELKELNQDTGSVDSSVDLLTYEGLTEKYGLLFIDVPHVNEYNSIKKQDIQEHSPNEFDLRKPMCAKYNPSFEASWFYAVGGRAGHVRIMCVNHLTQERYSMEKFRKYETYF